MNLPVWADTFECRSGVCCVTCRARTPQGHAFRERIKAKYCVGPGPDADFDCPVGVEWDSQRGTVRPMPQKEHSEGGCGCGGISETQKATDRPEK